MRMRNPRQIGDLWPLCGNCGHIAQAHDLPDVNNPDKPICCEIKKGQCPTCGTWAEKVPCTCKEYNGPSITQFIELAKLTREEINSIWGKDYDRRD